jgi:hypothetical protein
MSLVQGQSLRPQLGLVARFAVAFAVASFTVFALAGLVGTAAVSLLPLTVQMASMCAVLLLALALDGYSLRRKTWCPVTLRRQTPKDIEYRLGPRAAAVAWGLDTGLVFTTYRMSSISWALLVLGLLGVAPWWVGAGYAAGFLVPLTLGLLLFRVPLDSERGNVLGHLLARRTAVARQACVAALAVAVLASSAMLLR